MIPPVVVIVEIKAPAEKVFGFVGNVETHPEFADFCREVKMTTEKSNELGAKFHQFYVNGGECDSEIMVWEPFKKIVWHNFQGGNEEPVQIITYYFEQVGDVTHVLHTVENEAHADQALHRKGMQENVREMANLKRLVEG